MFTPVFNLIETGSPAWPWITLLLAFAVLAKCADLFVESAVAIAKRLRLSKLVIGLVLVSVATTSPELSVSMMAALKGNPEMALGNAIGSVICNCGIALALCGLFSASPVPVSRHISRVAGSFLVLTMVLLFFFTVHDLTLGRLEGAVLLLLFGGYLAFLFRQYRTGAMLETDPSDVHRAATGQAVPILVLMFAAGLGGVILSGKFVVVSSVTLAARFGVPESVIALTLVALGTSIPEVATSVTAAIKGQGALSVGNILGANIMNLCIVAGSSAVANPLTLGRREILFMFPAMFIMVAVTLSVLHTSQTLNRKEGALLFVCYLAYLGSFFIIFR